VQIRPVQHVMRTADARNLTLGYMSGLIAWGEIINQFLRVTAHWAETPKSDIPKKDNL
jgi:hypothetical protein